MKIIAISNPNSGNKNFQPLKHELKKSFSSHDFEFLETEKPLHATELAQYAVKQNPDIILAVGGDGTIIEIITGIIGSNVKLGIIPFGTGNMLALNLGISNDIQKAISTILACKTQRIDIGKIYFAKKGFELFRKKKSSKAYLENKYAKCKYFAFMTGCGLDAKIIKETSREKKKKIGLFAYFIEGFRHALFSEGASFKIRLDNKKTIKSRALTVLIANSGNIVGDFITLAPNASINDGLLDIIIISPTRKRDYLSILWRIISRHKPDKNEKIQHYQAKEIDIKAKPNIFVQADGDIIGKTPVKISIIPSLIEVIIP